MIQKESLYFGICTVKDDAEDNLNAEMSSTYKGKRRIKLRSLSPKSFDRKKVPISPTIKISIEGENEKPENFQIKYVYTESFNHFREHMK